MKIKSLFKSGMLRRFGRNLSDIYWTRRLKRLPNNWSGSPDTLAIISMPRSGSNYVCQLLNSHPDVYSHFEIFHREKVYFRDPEQTASDLNKVLSTGFRNYDDPTFVQFAHDQSERLIEALRILGNGRLLSFKVFPRHLSRKRFRELVISDRRIAKILLKRDYLSSYVSRKKAMKMKKWTTMDTSAIRVSLDPHEFQDYVRDNNYWFDTSEHLLKASGQKYALLDYDELMSIDSERARLAHMVDIIRTTGLTLPSLESAGVTEVNSRMKKQDRTRKLESTVENMDEFTTGLRQLGLEQYAN